MHAHEKIFSVGGDGRDGAGRVEINQEHCDTLRCFFSASVCHKESKKGSEKNFFFLLSSQQGWKPTTLSPFLVWRRHGWQKWLSFQTSLESLKRNNFCPNDCGLGAAEEVDLASCFTLIPKSALQWRIFIQTVYRRPRLVSFTL